VASPELRGLRRDEREPVLDLLETAFGARALFAQYMDCDPLYRAEDFLVAAEGACLVSCVQIFTKTVRLRGEPVLLGGIGSVATHPDHRKTGLASELLRRASAEMQRRGMQLSLLFGTRIRFYGRLGWHSIPQPRLVLHAPNTGASSPDAANSRAFLPSDLPRVRALYDDYTKSLDLATVRDAAYWAGQLRYAGNPGEDFRVSMSGGHIEAYARATRMDSGLETVLEFAREPGPHAATALAGLLLAMAPAQGALVMPRLPDPELERALREGARRLDEIPDPSAMWRVLDRASLSKLAALPASETDDRSLLAALVGHASAVYWPSDRF
jgi:predicted N-acetyltransferase YhbS